jgi:septal ring-binding cell division protein DamX
MVEQNVWHNYQTKLLGGGLLLIAIIISAALLSHYNHAPTQKKEVVLAIEPLATKSAFFDNQPANLINNQQKPLTTIEVSKVDIHPSAAPALSKPIINQPIAQNSNETPVQATAMQIASSQQNTPSTQTNISAVQPSAAQPVTTQESASIGEKSLPKPTAQPNVVVTKSLTTKSTTAIAPNNKTTFVKTTSSSTLAKTKAPAKNTVYTETEKRLLAIPKNHYTIQLVGANSNKNIQNFIKMHSLQGKAAYYQTYNNGKSWYVIVYGDYKTKAEAQAALKKLPAAVQAQHPWPRIYATVHTAIQRKLS